MAANTELREEFSEFRATVAGASTTLWSSREVSDAATSAQWRGVSQRLEQDVAAALQLVAHTESEHVRLQTERDGTKREFEEERVKLMEEICRSQKEVRAALDAAVLDCSKGLDDLSRRFEVRLAEEIAALREELRCEREERFAAAAVANEAIGGVRSAIEQEIEVRTNSLKPITEDAAALKALVQAEKRERLHTQERLEIQNAELGHRLLEEQALRERDSHSFHDSINEVLAAQQHEGQQRSEALEATGKLLQEVAAAAEARLAQHQAALEERFTKLDALEGTIEVSVEKEQQARELSLVLMARQIEDIEQNIAKIGPAQTRAEETLLKKIGEVAEQVEKGNRKLEEDVAEQDAKYASLTSRLQAEEQLRANEVKEVRTLCRTTDEAVDKNRQKFQDACAALATEDAKKREDCMEEVRRSLASYAEEQRKWFAVAIDQRSEAMTAANKEFVLEARTRGEELGREAAERIRSELMAEVGRIEASAAELIRAQDEFRVEAISRQDSQAQEAAAKVNECLTSHSEFMEALASEQQLLINRLNEGFALEDSKFDRFQVRFHALELDMQKVRGHLPILFVPTSFR